MNDMKPTTVIHIVVYLILGLTLLAVGLGAGASESRNTAYENKMIWKDFQIRSLTEDNIRLQSACDLAKLLDMALPPTYMEILDGIKQKVDAYLKAHPELSKSTKIKIKRLE